MQLNSLDRLLWALSFCGHCSLLAVLIFRRRITSFPLFTALITLNILRTIVLYFILGHASKDAYFYTYWTLAFLDVALQLAIVYELATHVFKPLGVWAPDVRQSFSIIVPASLVIAAALTWLASPVTRTLRQAIVARGNFFASAVLSEFFVAMVCLSVSIGLPWRTHAARLAQGLGFYAIFGIVLDAAHTHFASGATDEIFKSLSHIQMCIYLGCLAYWTVTLAKREPASRTLPAHVHQELLALQRRAALTLKLLRSSGAPS